MAIAGFVDRIVARLRATPVELARLPPWAFPGSIFSGAAGVAFFLHEAARLRGEGDLFDRARAWSAAARTWADRAREEDWRGFAGGFLIGASGLAYVEALLSAQEGDASGVALAVERLDLASASFDGFRPGFRRTELLGGSAGIVCAVLSLGQRLGGSTRDAMLGKLRRIRDRATAALEEAYAGPGRLATPDPLGMAHGFAGELWALLAVLGPNHELVRKRLGELAALRKTEDDGFVYWRAGRTGDERSLLGSWCNGMSGQSLLWTEVARRAPSRWSLKRALQAAESVARLAGPNPSLCCGLAGQSLALQRYAEASGDPRFGRRAYDRIARATRAVEASTAREPSLGLWQGELGVALVAMSRLAAKRPFPASHRQWATWTKNPGQRQPRESLPFEILPLPDRP